MEDDSLGTDEAFVMDKAAVMRQFEIGYQALGTEFAKGDSKSFSCVGDLRQTSAGFSWWDIENWRLMVPNSAYSG